MRVLGGWHGRRPPQRWSRAHAAAIAAWKALQTPRSVSRVMVTRWMLWQKVSPRESHDLFEICPFDEPPLCPPVTDAESHAGVCPPPPET